MDSRAARIVTVANFRPKHRLFVGVLATILFRKTALDRAIPGATVDRARDEVERTRAESSATDTLTHGVPSLSAHVQGGRGFDLPLPHMGRLHDLDASSLPRPRANMTNSAPSRPQGRRGISSVLPGTASGHKGLPRSFEERLAEDMLDEGLSPKDTAKGVDGVGSDNEDSGDQLRSSARRRAEGPSTRGAVERLPSSNAQGAPDFAELQGKPLQIFCQASAGASALSEGLPGQQRRVDSWASDMSEIEAVKLISNTKFEEVAAGPKYCPSVVQGFRSFPRAELGHCSCRAQQREGAARHLVWRSPGIQVVHIGVRRSAGRRAGCG